MKGLSTSALVLMTLSSIAIGLYAFGFQMRWVGAPTFHARFDLVPVAASMHVIGGGIVLLTGALQFWRPLRLNYPAAHRWLGRIYLSFIAIGGIGGLLLAFQSNGGVVTHFGFGILAVLWLFSGARAYQAIRAGRVKVHREWMIRNFALTFAAVTLRIYLGLFTAAGVPFEETYALVAWLCWVPNLILVEWYLTLFREAGKTAAG